MGFEPSLPDKVAVMTAWSASTPIVAGGAMDSEDGWFEHVVECGAAITASSATFQLGCSQDPSWTGMVGGFSTTFSICSSDWLDSDLEVGDSVAWPNGGYSDLWTVASIFTSSSTKMVTISLSSSSMQSDVFAGYVVKPRYSAG